MSISFYLNQNYTVESANYVTLVKPDLHPDRTLPLYDFLYIIDGTWEIIEEETAYSLHSDDLLILSAGRHHYGKLPCSPNNKHMYIHVYPLTGAVASTTQEETASLISKGDIMLEQKPSTNQEPDLPCLFDTLIHCQNNPQIKKLFEEIIVTHWSREELRERKLSLLFGLLLCEMKNQQNKNVVQPSPLLLKIVHFLHMNPQSFYTNEEIASKFFIGERTLRNHFKTTYGKTLSAFQMDVKLEMVHQYLITYPDTKLSEVARNYGFCDEFHLGKAYKKKYGISPKKNTATHALS